MTLRLHAAIDERFELLTRVVQRALPLLLVAFHLFQLTANRFPLLLDPRQLDLRDAHAGERLLALCFEFADGLFRVTNRRVESALSPFDRVQQGGGGVELCGDVGMLAFGRERFAACRVTQFHTLLPLFGERSSADMLFSELRGQLLVFGGERANAAILLIDVLLQPQHFALAARDLRFQHGRPLPQIAQFAASRNEPDGGLPRTGDDDAVPLQHLAGARDES